MPELTPIVLGLTAAMLLLGFVLGWILRGGRIRREKTAINASWQEQMIAQRNEHDRLADQNKSLMEQISQYRASKKDSDLRAKELSTSLKEAFEKRDELQRQIKDIRGNLDVAVARAEKLKADVESGEVRNQASASAIREKDDKIFKLSRELDSWQNRLPPLMERFRLRDLEARELEAALAKAEERFAALEKLTESEQTRIEPVDTNPIADGMDASNDQYDDTSEHPVSAADPTELAGSDDDVGHDDEPPAAADDEASDAVHAVSDGWDDASLAAADDERPDDGDDVLHAADDEPQTAADDAPIEAGNDEPVDAAIDRTSDSDQGDYSREEPLDAADAETFDPADDEASDSVRGDHEDEESKDGSSRLEHAGGGDERSAWELSSDDAAMPNRSANGADPRETAAGFDSHEFGGDGIERERDAPGDDAGDADDIVAASVNGQPASDGYDDLKQIKGVGPAIEKTLNDLGIYRFNQIAEMSEYDIDRVARELRGFRSRIYREDWIGQARILQYEKTSGQA